MCIRDRPPTVPTLQRWTCGLQQLASRSCVLGEVCSQDLGMSRMRAAPLCTRAQAPGFSGAGSAPTSEREVWNRLAATPD
eukprot:959710-Rhodomonas_salina.2